MSVKLYTCSFLAIAETATTLGLTETKVKLMLTIAEFGTISVDELAALYDIKPRGVREHMNVLINQGWIKKHEARKKGLIMFIPSAGDKFKRTVHKLYSENRDRLSDGG